MTMGEKEELNAKTYPATQLIASAIIALQTQKPNDRSELDRRYAIVITEAEKLLAITKMFLMG
jgi:hypothetical protein